MGTKTSVSTDRQIAALKARDAVYWVTVESHPGLRVKVTKGRTGTTRTFAYRYRAPDGRQELKMIGAYEPPHFGLAEARAKWRELRDIRAQHGYVKAVLEQERAANVAAIEATTAQGARDAYTVRKLAEAFVDHQSTQIKTWKKTKANLDLYVLPELGDVPAGEVSRKDVTAVLDTLRRAGKNTTANRTLAALRAAYNWAIEREKPGIEFNPCAAVKPTRETPRERRLSDVEIARVFKHFPDTDLTDDERDLLEFILLTACRLSEAAGASMDEFDTDAALWVLPAARSKNGREHRLPLSRQALALIKRRRGGSWLFPLDDKRPMRADHIHTPLREAIPALKVLPFTPHDLRRTAATGIATLKAPRDIVRRILNHTDRSVTARYDLADRTDEVRDWLQQWADHIDRLRGVKVKRRRARA